MKIQIDNLGKVAITVEESYWDNNKAYDKLVVVEVAGIGAYLSRKPVPKGTSLNNRNYWIKISGKSGPMLPITQSLGYDEEVAISQKIITEAIDNVNRRIDEIIAGGTQINFTVNPISVNVGTSQVITLSVVCETQAEKIRIEDSQGNLIGEEGSGLSHSVTTIVQPSIGGTTIDFVAKITINSIVITKNVSLTVNLLQSGISWSKNSAVVTIGGPYNLPTFNNPNNLPITFSSSNTNVATINSHGVVTINAIGTTNISANFAGNNIYAPKQVTYALTVEEVKLPVLYGANKNVDNVNWINTESVGLPDNLRITVTITEEGDYIFLKIPKNTTFRTLHTYNDMPQWRYPVDVISVSSQDENYNIYRTADNDGWAVGNIELIINQTI